MAKIEILDTHTINQIAAGEVVERPSSVVKELVENSIDASASSITVEIKGGGIELIRITDNGTGIEKDEIETAFLRHATSKIKLAKDLNTVTSLGFRGEALASIAAVSMVELISKKPKQITGKRVVFEGGEINASEEVACPEGTTFIMRNLFYNVPARKAFLKSPSTEGAKISDYLYKLALANPHISFKYFRDNKLIFQTSGNQELKPVVFQLYGKDIAAQTIPLYTKVEHIEIAGLLGKPSISRGNRNYENFFINGRFINSALLQKAVEEAYKTLTMVGKFPVAILHLTMPPEQVDVNVHPTKLEVRFKNSQSLYDFVYESVLMTIRETNMVPTISEAKQIIAKPIDNKVDSQQVLVESFFVPHKTPEKLQFDKLVNKPETPQQSPKIFEPTIQVEQKTKSVTQPLPKRGIDYDIIGQIFETYWLIKHHDKVFVMDQHAAHERVLYEKFMQDYTNSTVHSQQLLVPETINLSPLEMNTIKENIDTLNKLGFLLEIFGDSDIIVREVPYIFNMAMPISKFKVFLEDFRSSSNIYLSEEERIITMSCKAAIKGNDKIDMVECDKLVQFLLALDNPYSCPHGRPTLISMQKIDIEKLFKRV
ncbi:MAG: hypothetical protein ATN35_13555 [Epulopiscium sp. Nele67-Bin004]|nr:MAG: hypothetical protein ATN35_13555 [Epulopiscium sp. Nele67-Bin004]